MCPENGPSLPLAIDVLGSPQLQSLRAVPHLHLAVQLGVFRQLGVVDVEGTIRAERLSGRDRAREYHPHVCHRGDHGVGVDGVYGLAHLPLREGPDHH